MKIGTKQLGLVLLIANWQRTTTKRPTISMILNELGFSKQHTTVIYRMLSTLVEKGVLIEYTGKISQWELTNEGHTLVDDIMDASASMETLGRYFYEQLV